jgi:hypothetical protein
LKERYEGWFFPPELDGLIAELLKIPPDLDESEKREKVKRLERKFRKKEHRRKYPERYTAKLLVKAALLKKQITKPERCSYCGKVGKVIAHHENYYEPLKVIWLCALCHWCRHRGNGYYEMPYIRVRKNQWLCYNCHKTNSTKYNKCCRCGERRGVIKIRRNKRMIKGEEKK